MNRTIVVVLVVVILLALEWRYRLRSVRLATASLAPVLWFFTQPSPTSAARRVLEMPPAEHAIESTEFRSGVRTMEQAVSDNAMMFWKEPLLSVGVLFWLACSPVFRRATTSSGSKPGTSPAVKGAA